MYTSVIVRILSTRTPPLEGHIIDLSETGMSIELDAPIPVGEAVTVQFQVSGLGSQRDGLWAQYAAAGEVVRHDRSDDFPAGPCRIALKLLEISTMTQAQIARYIATYAA